MKNIYNIIEELEGASTPGNTMGMGDPMMPSVTDGQPGTEPYMTAKSEVEKPKRKRKRKCKECDKSLKELLEESLLDNEINNINDESYAEEILIKKWLDENCYIYNGDAKIYEKGNKWYVDGHSLMITNESIKNIPTDLFRFNKFIGDFSCSKTNLTTLEGCPNECDSFSCGYTKITTLEGCPQIIHGSFSCNDCTALKSLKGAPKLVRSNFDCNSCTNLKDLKYSPDKVGWNFICKDCTNLKELGCSNTICRGFDVINCINLLTLINGPKKTTYFWAINCPKLKSYDITTEIKNPKNLVTK